MAHRTAVDGPMVLLWAPVPRGTITTLTSHPPELLKLLAALRTEIGDLARTNSDEAHRIAAIARNSTEALQALDAELVLSGRGASAM